MALNSNHHLREGERLVVEAESLSPDTHTLKIKTPNARTTIFGTIGQMRQIFDALESLILEYDEAAALAQFDAQRDDE